MGIATAILVSNMNKNVYCCVDGYQDGPSTNDVVHQKLSSTSVGATVQVSDSMVFKGKQEDHVQHKDIALSVFYETTWNAPGERLDIL